MDKAFWDFMRWDMFRWDVYRVDFDESINRLKKASLGKFVLDSGHVVLDETKVRLDVVRYDFDKAVAKLEKQSLRDGARYDYAHYDRANYDKGNSQLFDEAIKKFGKSG